MKQGRPIWDGRRGSGGRPWPLQRLAGAAALVPAAENSPETRGAGALRVPGATGVAWEVGEGAGSLLVGARSGQGHRRGGPRRSGSAAAQKGSGEQSNATGGNTKVGRGRERFLTSRRAPGTPRWRQWRDGGPGRRWRTPAAARRTAGERGQREIGRGGEIGARPGLRTSRRSSPWQRARRSSNGDGETGSGRQRFNGGGALRVRGVGEVREGSAGAQMREGVRASGVLGSSGRGRGGCELHARRGRGVRGSAQLGRRLRGDDGADSRDPRAERAGKRARVRGKRLR